MRRVLFALALFSMMLAPARADERPELAVRRFQIEHLKAREANAILPSILDVRKSALDESTNTLVLSDAPARLAEVEKLLKAIDVARPLWSAELVAHGADGRATVVRLPLAGDAASWHAGGTAGSGLDQVRLDMASTQVGDDGVTLQIRFEAVASASVPAHLLRRELACTASLADGGALELARAAHPVPQRALAAILGAPDPVTALELVVRRDGATASGRKLGR